jgi:hypothetical protein
MCIAPCGLTSVTVLQIKRYDLVIELSEDGAGLGARQIRNSSRDTLRDIEQDMALATALAQVRLCLLLCACVRLSVHVRMCQSVYGCQ